LFYDDLAHRPVSDPDAEIIERAMAVQTLAGKAIWLVTMDTGMGLNAPGQPDGEEAGEGDRDAAGRGPVDAGTPPSGSRGRSDDNTMIVLVCALSGGRSSSAPAWVHA
jgi:hypothetical protein